MFHRRPVFRPLPPAGGLSLPRIGAIRSACLSHRRGRPWRLPTAVLLFSLCVLSVGANAELPERLQAPGLLSRDVDRSTRIDVNRIDMATTNHGSFGYDIPTGNPGLIYPSGGQNTSLFAGGLWVGARVSDNDLRVAIAEYSFEYTPGRIEADGSWDPNYQSNPRWRTYKIERGDTPGSNPDYDEWPVQDGAPVDENGDPRHLGDQTLWSVYHDANPAAHMNDAGFTEPLGMEVQQTAFAFGIPGTPSEIVFVEWKFINKGTEDWRDTYVSAWSDPDLGGANDDFVGSDPERSLGFCYNATNNDNQYGASPPAIGFRLVQGPIVPSPGDIAYVNGVQIPGYRNLPMTAFSKYINGTDPSSAVNTYYYMQGLERDGSPVINPVTGEVTTFAVSGDPLTGEGWLDTDPSDRRMMISAGPFDLRVGESQTVVVAIVMGQGSNRLDSVLEMSRNVDRTEEIFRAVYSEGVEGACCTTNGVCLVTSVDQCVGTFFGGEDCLPNVCLRPLGACCYDNGTCALTYEDDCSGAFQGGGSDCVPGLCPVYGPDSACCFGDGTCEVLTEHACLDAGGTYLADAVCGLFPPGSPVGWELNDRGVPMIDEVVAGGDPVPPDGHGGPGNDVWHSHNSTGEWILSAGGGDGGVGRFTRDGADELNLTRDDIELRWDNGPDNYGWWGFEDQSVGRIPFGLYLVDPSTGEETRLLVLLFSGGGSTGTYDISSETPDGWQQWPATDWAYAYTGDYDAFLADALDGELDSDHGEDELFARLVFASPASTLPPEDTVIRFTTKKTTITAVSGYGGEVPIAWVAPGGTINCFDPPIYEVFRDGAYLGASERTDYLDRGAVAGREYLYSIRSRNPVTGETSELSASVPATADTEGYFVSSGAASSSPTLDGVVSDGEWDDATIVDAAPSPLGPAAQIRLMNDGDYLYVAIEDGALADVQRIYLDSNGNGSYDQGVLEGMLQIRSGVPSFVRAQGSYPHAKFLVSQMAGTWAQAASTEQVMELRISLANGPLASRDPSGIVPMFFSSVNGVASYPPGPESVVREAPWLFSRVQLATGVAGSSDPEGGSGEGETADVLAGNAPVLPEVQRALGFPNPFVGTATLAFRVPSTQSVSVRIFAVDGSTVRVLLDGEHQEAGVHAVEWDGRGESRGELPPGVYFYEVRGENFRWTDRITLIR